MLRERVQGVARAGCRLWWLQHRRCLNVSRDEAEVVVMGRRFHSLMVRGKKEWSRAGWLTNSWRSLLAPLVLESEGWQNLVSWRSTRPF